jgi:hypothetical protein
MKIFLSHSSSDKSFTRILAEDLLEYGFNVWLDEWEIKVGDSITQKISDGIDESLYLIIILSKSSVSSKWVKKELNSALSIELDREKVFILPVLIEDCEIPALLKDKKYADFRSKYHDGLGELLRVFGAEQFGSKVYSFPENIRLKKNEKSDLKFRYNVYVKASYRNIQKIAASFFGLTEVEDMRILSYGDGIRNFYLHCNKEVADDDFKSICVVNNGELIKNMKYYFKEG